jgi:SHS2 domain-containing protein
MKPYEPFDHPADIGLVIRGGTQESLFTHAALGFADLVTDVHTLRRTPSANTEEMRISLQAPDTQELLYLWLKELLYHFSAASLLFTEFRFGGLSETNLAVLMRGTRFDPSKHVAKMEVKAVTRHQFSAVKSAAGAWEARVIFDV